ncbi:aminotransferase [Halteromyces radiatus]|uniref:aminotransferase n=1 Tax=Halteromyces radiatus TaxID=101107 RepID=UPI002221031B|nr:aminotransferase [Halteromyces radiatus]KAI8097165.1 aminotransferase [Halteromyces radiatus]
MEKKTSSTGPSSSAKHHFYDIAQKVVEQIRSEKDSEAHREFRSHSGNIQKKSRDAYIFGIEHPGSTGVIYTTDRATKLGFRPDDPTWANFGQGAPEVGHIDGCMDKPTHIEIPLASLEYAPVAGCTELRSAVANLYNEIYRKNKTSKYTAENVCIVPGGRAGMTRVASVIADVEVGYFLPEYTAYEQMLSIFKRFVPIPTSLDEEVDYSVDSETLRKHISGCGISLIVRSNPSNPTGTLVEGEELKKMIQVGRDRHATMVFDEFYSAYIYSHDESQNGRTVSAAEFIDDVNTDNVVIVDGLTKNFRLPGWRICWVVGPKRVINAVEAAGSFSDGGANHPLQLAAVPMLQPETYRNEAKALQRHFRMKRDIVLKRLKEMGFVVRKPPRATFYIWLDLSALPPPINAGLVFFEECLKEKTILVPGIFFDINPAHRRELFDSPCHHFVRLSFGPPLDDLMRGLDGMQRVINKFKKV